MMHAHCFFPDIDMDDWLCHGHWRLLKNVILFNYCNVLTHIVAC